MTNDRSSTPRRLPAVQPRALIVTVYGLYARDRDGWMAVSSLVDLMQDLGVDEPAVRSAISRLKRRGVLVADTRASTAGYRLSAEGLAILDAGDRRIFRRTRAGVQDGWLLAVFSVPESERRRRHQLRSQLAWLGFGTVAAGVWVGPAHLAAEAEQTLRHQGLDDYVTLFRADHLGFGDIVAQVAQWWDLDDLGQMYSDFVQQHQPMLRNRRRSAVSSAAAEQGAFADYVTAVTAWRRLPFLDPGLPLQVLPRRWAGVHAAEVFDALELTLTTPAARHVERVTGVRGSRSPAPRRAPRRPTTG